MDKSPEYIKQCEKAVEIRALWQPSYGDVLWHPFYGILLVTEVLDNNHYGTILLQNPHKLIRWDRYLIEKTTDKRETIWLPRQDQLQEIYLKGMPDGTYQKIATFAEAFHDYHETNGYPVYAFSMEQLTLAFVQKELHNKSWGGEDWIKEVG